MEVANITSEARQPGGRHGNERLRRGGMIPAVIYGHGEKPEHVSLSLHDLELALRAGQHVIQFPHGGKTSQFLIKEIQYDHLQRTPIHADLMRVDITERVRVKVPVDLRGDPKGVADGGERISNVTDIEIECGLLEIPDSIRVNIGHLKIGDAIHVREVELPAGAKAVSHLDEIVVAVRHKRVAVETAAVEGAIEPEVIGRVAKEEPKGDE